MHKVHVFESWIATFSVKMVLTVFLRPEVFKPFSYYCLLVALITVRIINTEMET